MQLCRDVTASMGLLMLKEGIYQAHQKLVQRTAAAINDAKSIHKGKGIQNCPYIISRVAWPAL